MTPATLSRNDYNCIAWAASLTDVNWWPYPYDIPGWGWPDGVPRTRTLDSFQKAYATIRYKSCGRDGSLHPKYEKIAIYVDPDGRPTHAARQLYNGHWTSKLGRSRDIHHTTPRGLEIIAGSPWRDDYYGTVALYMRRKRRVGGLCLAGPSVPDVPPVYKESGLVRFIRRIFGA